MGFSCAYRLPSHGYETVSLSRGGRNHIVAATGPIPENLPKLGDGRLSQEFSYSASVAMFSGADDTLSDAKAEKR